MDTTKEARISTNSPTHALRYDNSELEKFKRRLIRAVARMLLQEKRNENEVWEGLREETGCDCKKLWTRMHALTKKKLNCLLEAQDRVDLLPAAARMSITDWLLFDTVLVHEDFDVIGMTETTVTDRPVLVDLFDLVQKHQLDSQAGSKLADAWAAATLEYNKQNRQCSPMLLQRRWYQLKLATRVRFYTFWSMYKGVTKKLKSVEMYKPTPLQTMIAKWYKPLVVMPFVQWEELVQNNLVILPEEFGRKGMDIQGKEEESTPDVMCIEPDLEVIDVDADSDSDLEYRKQKSDECPVVNIKQEPQDELDIEENVPYVNRSEKKAYFAEAVMEATAMELNEIDLEADISSNNTPELKDDVVEMPLAEDSCENKTLESINVKTLVQADTLPSPVITLSPEHNVEPVIDVDKEDDIAPTPVIENNEIPPVKDVDIQENNTVVEKEPEIVLPQITSIFGGVDVSNETLSTISILTAQMTKSGQKPIMAEAVKPQNDSTIDLSSDSAEDITSDDVNPEENSNEAAPVVKDTVKNEAKSSIDVKPDINKSSWFGELSNDVDFTDDGIQFVDDGIAYVDDECAYQMNAIKTEIKTEKDEEDVVELIDDGKTEDEDVPKVDKKLLLVPQVRVVRIDEMGILPLNLLEHIDNKAIIDMILFKSKPILQEEDQMSESSYEDITEKIKKVKLSSNLLQKPRSRTYNPIQLCKNPDFNTRLKRLSIGFFSSSRNCSLLRACKPLTIDVSKAFENRLKNGTLYLEPTDDKYSPKIDLTETSQNVSVVPSAMAVQSLIDNKSNVNSLEYPATSLPNSMQSNSLISERSKPINLPDITEIRRINQKLLTAQVTPLQFKNDSAQVPVTIVSSTNGNNQVNTVINKPEVRRMAGPASRTRLPLTLPKAINITKDETPSNLTPKTAPIVDPTSSTNFKETTKPQEKIVPWKPRNTKSDVPWNNLNSSIYSEDTLLALDTLNKMLFLLSDDGTSQVTLTSKKSKGTSGKIQQPKKQDKKPQDDDVQVVGETKVNSTKTNKTCNRKKSDKPVNNQPLKRKPYTYCCWAKEKICQVVYSKKRISKHNCPYPLCLCCCQVALEEFNKRRHEQEIAKMEKEQNIEGRPCVATQVNSQTLQEENPSVKTGDDISTDIAVITPIQQNPPEELSSGVLFIEGNKESSGSANSDNKTNVADVVSDESTLGEIVVVSSESNANETIAFNYKTRSTETIIDVSEPDSNQSTVNEAAVNTILDPSNNIDLTTSDEPIVNSVKPSSDSIDISKEPKTDMRPPPPPPKQRFRVKAATELVDLKRKRKHIEEPVRVTAGKPQSVIVIDPTKPYPQRNKQMRTEQKTKVPINSLPPPSKKSSNNKSYLSQLTKPNIIRKTYNPSQKMLYLNSKQIAEQPSSNPIFLGKNKILLTTAKFPANFKAFEAYVSNIRQTLALPRGIQLILKPNGQISYTREPMAILTTEFMDTLPQLIQAIQTQIDASVIYESKYVATQSQCAIINLIDDDAPIITENCEKSSETVLKDNADQISTISNTSIENSDRNAAPKILVNTLEGVDNAAAETTDTQAKQNTHASENETQIGQGPNITESPTQEEHDPEISEIVTQEVEGSKISENKTNEKPDLKVSENTTQEKPDPEISETVTEKVKDPKISEDTARVEQIPKISKNGVNENIDLTQNETVSTDAEENTGITNTKEIIAEHSETIDLCTENVSENKNTSSSGKPKNILSDLMAMSGIGPIDVTPTSEETLPTEVSQEISTVPDLAPTGMPAQEISVQPTIPNTFITPIIMPTLQRIDNVSVDGTQTSPNLSQTVPSRELLPQSLTAITSLSELKFACTQDALFFKLDLDTGLLVPINVCMKKLEAQSEPRLSLTVGSSIRPIAPRPSSNGDAKPVIDLTDDDACDSNPDVTLMTTGQSTTDSIKISSKGCESKVDETAINDYIKEVQRKDIKVKPLKLFKSGRPSALEKKLKEIQKRISNAMTARDNVRRQLKRKQDQFAETIPPAFDPNFGQLTMDTNSSDCSSDDEPLAKVAIKMRATENIIAMKKDTVKKPDSENIPKEGITETVEMHANDAPVVSDAPLGYKECQLIDGEPILDDITAIEDDMDIPLDELDEPIQCLEEHSLDDNDGEEDCILGV